MPLTVALTVFAVTCAVSDARSARIPNWLVLAGLVVAVMVRASTGASALGSGLAGMMIGLAVGFPLFALGGLGAGDVKFMAACGAFVGLPLIGKALLFAGAAGGVLAIVVIARRRLPFLTALRAWNLLRHATTLGQGGERMTLQDAGAVAAPYGVAIAAGVLFVWFGNAGGWIP